MPFKDIKENIDSAHSIIHSISTWATKGKYRMLLIILILQAFTILSPYAYLASVISDSKQFNDTKFQKADDLNTEHSYKITLDLLNICINTKDEQNREWYCNRAKGRYLESAKKWQQNETEEYLENNLYEMMVVDVSHYLRSLKFRNVMRQEFSNQYIIDTVSSKGFATFSIIALCLTTLVFMAISGMYYRKR